MPKEYKLTEDDKEFLCKLPITNEQLVELFKYMNEYKDDHVNKTKEIEETEETEETKEINKIN